MTITGFRDFAIVILAAGRSERMGARNKLLQHAHGKPLLAHSLETVASLAPDQLIVVTGHEHEPVSELARRYGAHTVHNASYRDGMGTSLACGARAVSPLVKGVFVHLGDVPFVSARTFHDLAKALIDDRQGVHQAFAPLHEGKRGHPVLFRHELLRHLGELRGDEGARAVLGANSCLEVSVCDPNIIRDVDTQADLTAISNQA